MDRVEALLAGPRGRRVCLELLVPDPFLNHSGPPYGPVGPASAIRRLIDRIADTDLAAVADVSVRAALADSVAHARYWQEPDELDQLLAVEAVAACLAPVAHALADRPGTSWWWDASACEAQVTVERQCDEPVRSPLEPVDLTAWRAGVLAEEERDRRERPDDPTAAWGGAWWSTPSTADLVVSVRSHPEPPPALDLVEDDLGWPRALVRRARPDPAARVYEIDGPDAWSALVERYSLPVPYSRRQDWFRAIGSDRHWLIPDYLAAATDWDAIHLSVAGYLATAGTAVPAADGWSVLAGWSPDETWWLTDTVVVDTSTESWLFDEESRRWTRQPEVTSPRRR